MMLLLSLIGLETLSVAATAVSTDSWEKRRMNAFSRLHLGQGDLSITKMTTGVLALQSKRMLVVCLDLQTDQYLLTPNGCLRNLGQCAALSPFLCISGFDETVSGCPNNIHYSDFLISSQDRLKSNEDISFNREEVFCLASSITG